MSAKSILNRQFEIADYARSDIVNYYESTEPASSTPSQSEKDSKVDNPLYSSSLPAAKENAQLSAFEASVEEDLHNGADYLHLAFLNTVNMYVVQSRDAPKSEEEWTRNFVEKAWRRVYLGKQQPHSPSGKGITSKGPECTLRCKFENGQMKCDQKTDTDQHVLELYRPMDNSRTEVSEQSKKDAHTYFRTGKLASPDTAFLEEEERSTGVGMFGKNKGKRERSDSIDKWRTVGSRVARESGATLGFKTATFAKAGHFLKPKKDETKLLIQGMTCRFFVRDFLNDERRVVPWSTRKNKNVRDMMKRAYPALYSLNPPADEDGISDVYITEADVSEEEWETATKKDQTLKRINPADPAYLKIYKLIKAKRTLHTGETAQVDLDFGFSSFLAKALDWAILKHYITLIKPKAQVEADRAFLQEALKESKKNPKSTTKSSEDKVVHDNVCLEGEEMAITATLALSASVGTDKGAIQAAVVGGGYYAELSRETAWQWEGKKKGNKCVIVKKSGAESAMSAAAMVGGMLSLSVLRYDDDEDTARRTLAVTLSFEDVNSALLPAGFSKLCESGFGAAMKKLLRGILFPLWFGGADDESDALDDKVSKAKSKWKTTKLADVGTKVKTFLT